MREPLTEQQKQLASAAEHVAYAEAIAVRRRQSILPVEDRIQEASLGLIDAARTFDPAGGVKFTTFAHRRILGAIMDAERSSGSALIKTTRRLLSQGVVDPKVVSIESFNVPNSRGGRDAIGSDFLFVDDDPPAAETVDQRDAIDAALKGLPEMERSAVRAYWLDGKTMKRVAAEIGVTESRVSQVVQRSLARLREHSALSHYAGVA